ncbi:unnamed protein product [Ambrosiozyma monospora]|uniref:Unnamed protein product n=1 Tax=Ambrosiozyma monospora TaxID=43982 RepID=A0A9W7DK81_AMBMO|nr:unnamed protein product [Ambrosiozyma monospora]
MMTPTSVASPFTPKASLSSISKSDCSSQLNLSESFKMSLNGDIANPNNSGSITQHSSNHPTPTPKQQQQQSEDPSAVSPSGSSSTTATTVKQEDDKDTILSAMTRSSSSSGKEYNNNNDDKQNIKKETTSIAAFTPPASTRKASSLPASATQQKGNQNHALLDLSNEFLNLSSSGGDDESPNMIEMDPVDDDEDPKNWMESILKETLDEDMNDDDDDMADFKESAGLISEDLLKFDFAANGNGPQQLPNTAMAAGPASASASGTSNSTSNNNHVTFQNKTMKPMSENPNINTSISNNMTIYSIKNNSAPALNLPFEAKPALRYAPHTETTEEKMEAYNLLRSGLLRYNQILKAAHAEDTVCTRADFLIKYVYEQAGYKLRPKALIDYFGNVRHEDKYIALAKELGDADILQDIRDLLQESDRRRKCYNKRKSSRAEKERKLAAAAAQAGVNSLNQQNHQLTQQQLQQLQLQQQAQQQQLQQPLTPLSAKMPIRANGQPPQLQFGPQQQQQLAQFQQQQQQSIDERGVITMTPMQMQMAAANNANNNNNSNKLQVRDMSLELIKIGYVSHAMPDEGTPPFYGLANLQSTIRVFEDEIYVQNLHSKNNSLKKFLTRNYLLI